MATSWVLHNYVMTTLDIMATVAKIATIIMIVTMVTIHDDNDSNDGNHSDNRKDGNGSNVVGNIMKTREKFELW